MAALRTAADAAPPRQGEPDGVPGTVPRQADADSGAFRSTWEVHPTGVGPAPSPQLDTNGPQNPSSASPGVSTWESHPTTVRSRARSEARSQDRSVTDTPTTRREATRRERDERRAQLERQRQALVGGDERYLPVRDKGPVRRFARDFIDSRFNVAEFFLPMAVVILVLSMVRVGSLQSIALLLWLVVIVLIVLDSIVTGFRLKKGLAERFPDENRRGVAAYALTRSLQMRRLRLPRPQVGRGERP
ncbi:DUF3043 domain-containing protein [Streptomyces scopuliridis]|uniref:DUF3043 domain-containing protein n=1 Tax=Streptomyces scopuliridis TaxID=452529 RepID=UPI0036B52A80